MAVNEDGVLATGGDNGSMWYWDWKSGHNFQQDQSIVQPGERARLLAPLYPGFGRVFFCACRFHLGLTRPVPDFGGTANHRLCL